MPTARSLPRILPEPAAGRGSAPAVKAAVLHALCIPLALGLAALAPVELAWQPVAALLAVLGGFGIGLAPWWALINAGFVPALSLALSVEMSPHWFLGAFALLALTYWGVGSTQVPLFLSSDAAAQALLARLPAGPGVRFLDLGCGDARLLSRLAGARRDCRFHGVEYAPLPWLAGWLRLLHSGGGTVHWGDLWRHDLSCYDVVYAYLSPVPMPELWQKVRREMRPGSLFVSNTFAVPGVAASEVVPLGDAWGGQLYLYRI